MIQLGKVSQMALSLVAGKIGKRPDHPNMPVRPEKGLTPNRPPPMTRSCPLLAVKQT
jgi:hypothetical protein